MNDFFLRVGNSSKAGMVYRIYVKEVTEPSNSGSSAAQNTASELGGTAVKTSKPIKKVKGKKRQQRGRKYLGCAANWRLSLIEPYIKEVIKRNTPKKDVQKTLEGNTISQKQGMNGETLINEEDGVRLSILFRSISRLQKMARIDDILANVRSINREEAYYWYSKIFTQRKNKKGMRAFRELFG